MEQEPLEEHFILRLPPSLASQIRPLVQSRQLPPDLKILVKDRYCKLEYKNTKLNGQLLDLPCITESLKTIDNKQFYKIGDVSQIMTFIKTDNKDFITKDGLTYPMRNCKESRFRKRLSKKVIEVVESEVERLLQLDLESLDVKYEIHHRNFDQDSSEEEEINDNNDEDEDDFDLEAIIDKTITEDQTEIDKESDQETEEEDNNSDQDEIQVVEDENDTELVQQIKIIKVEIQQLELKLQEKHNQWESCVNLIMKDRLKGICDKLEKELGFKKEVLQKLESSEDSDDDNK